MSVNFIRYCLRQTKNSIQRNFWLALVSAAVIAVSLTILGGFLLVALNAGQFMRNIETALEISVFLKDNVDLEAIEEELQQLDGVLGYSFVSKEEGLKEFSRDISDESLFAELQGEKNPLPHLFRVQVEQTELVPELAKHLSTLPGVEKVSYGEELVNWLLRAARWVNLISLSLGVLLAAAAVFLIVTSIRLSVLSRQEEIGIMKYLGASNWFIRFPFLLEGMLIGWFGTLVSVAAVGFSYYQLAAALQRASLGFFLQPVTDAGRILAILGGLLLMGTVMGGMGALISVRKFLRV
ncbi:MAG: permease-like cell division protein FtsX [Dethiobacteria bacterium]|jgi:cell division transport system permease protein